MGLPLIDVYVAGAAVLILCGNVMGCVLVCCCCSNVFRHKGYAYSKTVRTTDDEQMLEADLPADRDPSRLW